MKVNEKDIENLKILPAWVKCMDCGLPPTKEDWLIEIVPHSSALRHQSCAAKRGQMAGMNVGTIQEIGGKIQALKGDAS